LDPLPPGTDKIIYPKKESEMTSRELKRLENRKRKIQRKEEARKKQKTAHAIQ
jgi:hypothetical protein